MWCSWTTATNYLSCFRDWSCPGIEFESWSSVPLEHIGFLCGSGYALRSSWCDFHDCFPCLWAAHMQEMVCFWNFLLKRSFSLFVVFHLTTCANWHCWIIDASDECVCSCSTSCDNHHLHDIHSFSSPLAPPWNSRSSHATAAQTTLITSLNMVWVLLLLLDYGLFDHSSAETPKNKHDLNICSLNNSWSHRHLDLHFWWRHCWSRAWDTLLSHLTRLLNASQLRCDWRGLFEVQCVNISGSWEAFEGGSWRCSYGWLVRAYNFILLGLGLRWLGNCFEWRFWRIGSPNRPRCWLCLSVLDRRSFYIYSEAGSSRS